MSTAQIAMTCVVVFVLVIGIGLGVSKYNLASAHNNACFDYVTFKNDHLSRDIQCIFSRNSQNLIGYCNDKSIEKLNNFISKMEQKFNHTEQQLLKWNRLVTALRNEEQTMLDTCEKLALKENYNTSSSHLELVESLMLTGIEVLQRVRPLFDDYYNSLGVEQQVQFDEQMVQHRRHHNH